MGARGKNRLNLLLDTRVFIWSVSAPAKLDEQARAAVAAPDNRVFVSAVTAWEIAIKHALGRLKFPIERFDDIMLRIGFDALPILPAHAIAAGGLPPHHDDPFDRMLIAQARIERFVLVSSEQTVRRYDVLIFGDPG